jgi:hypothetical protein
MHQTRMIIAELEHFGRAELVTLCCARSVRFSGRNNNSPVQAVRQDRAVPGNLRENVFSPARDD